MYEVDTYGNPTDWNAAAAEAADRIVAHRFSEHVGVMEWWKPGTAVVFGNRGYNAGERGQLAVHLLRQSLADAGVIERGFGVNGDDGDTWAMIVEIAGATAKVKVADRLFDRPGRITIDDYLPDLHTRVVDACRIAQDAKPDDPEWIAYKQVQGLVGVEDLDSTTDNDVEDCEDD